jgi:polar amino acid transport system substrate-binding protein
MKRTWIVLIVAMGLVGTACESSTSGGAHKITPPPDSALFTAGTLTLGSDISYPPQEFYDPAGSQNAAGFDIDIAKEMASRMGLKFAAVNQTFAGIIPALSAKKYDIIMSAMTINDDRKAKVDFVPYFIAGESFVVQKGAKYRPTKLEDLCGHKVAVEDGTAEKDEANGLNDAGKPCANNKVHIDVYQVDTEALAQLKKTPNPPDEVHFTDSPVADYEIRKDANLEKTGTAIETAPEGIACRKGDTAIFNPIKAAFDSIKSDGTYKTLLDKWGLAAGDITKTTT